MPSAKIHKCVSCFFLFSHRRHNSNHKLLLLTPAGLFAFLLHYNESMMVPFVIKQQYERGKKSDLNHCARVCVQWFKCVLSMEMTLFLSAELVIWADPCKGTLSLCSPAIGLTFVLSHSHLFIWKKRKWKDGILRSPHCLAQEGGRGHFFEVFSRQMRMLQFINLRPGFMDSKLTWAKQRTILSVYLCCSHQDRRQQAHKSNPSWLTKRAPPLHQSQQLTQTLLRISMFFFFLKLRWTSWHRLFFSVLVLLKVQRNHCILF